MLAFKHLQLICTQLLYQLVKNLSALSRWIPVFASGRAVRDRAQHGCCARTYMGEVRKQQNMFCAY